MLPKSALKDMFPVVMTPSHDGKYFQNFTFSLIELLREAGSMSMPLGTFLLSGESLVTRARNNCVASFLENKQWTHLVFIDSDIGFSTMAFFRLLLSDHDVATGIYPLKKEAWPEKGVPDGMTQVDFQKLYTHYTVNHSKTNESGDVHLKIGKDGFMEVEEAPTGFMSIKREVIEKMVKAYPELQYTTDSDYGPTDKGFHYNFFDTSIDPKSNRYLSEDYHFCYLWQAIGGKIFADVQSNLSHQGSKTYRGSFAESLISNPELAICAPAGKKIIVDSEEPLLVNEKPLG